MLCSSKCHSELTLVSSQCLGAVRDCLVPNTVCLSTCSRKDLIDVDSTQVGANLQNHYSFLQLLLLLNQLCFVDGGAVTGAIANVVLPLTS